MIGICGECFLLIEDWDKILCKCLVNHFIMIFFLGKLMKSHLSVKCLKKLLTAKSVDLHAFWMRSDGIT